MKLFHKHGDQLRPIYFTAANCFSVQVLLHTEAPSLYLLKYNDFNVIVLNYYISTK